MSAVKVVVVALLLTALVSLPAQAAIIYVKSTATGSNDGTTCANAYTSFNTAVTNWTTADIIYVDDDHAQTYSASQNFNNASSSYTTPIEVVAVDCDASDVYDVPTSGAHLDSTGDFYYLDFDGHWSIEGLRLITGDDISFTVGGADSSGSAYTKDMHITFNGNGTHPLVHNSYGHYEHYNMTLVDTGAANSFYIRSTSSSVSFYDLTFSGDGPSLFAPDGARAVIKVYGADLSGWESGNILVDQSDAWNLYSSSVEFYNMKMPASFTTHDSGFNQHGQYILLVGVGNQWNMELHNADGETTTVTSTYRNGGFVHADGSTSISFRMAPLSSADDGYPMEGLPLTAYVASTGQKTFSLYVCHTFTVAPTKAQLWFEVLYLSESGEPLWTIAESKDELGSTALDSTTETWVEGTTCSEAQIDLTVTINAAGLYRVVPRLAKYEAGKVVFVDPRVTVQ